jgi:hypothetical protein
VPLADDEEAKSKTPHVKMTCGVSRVSLGEILKGDGVHSAA